jgi:hypothetical protein
MESTSPPERPASPSGPPALAVGAIIVVIGLILLVTQIADLGIGELGWPFWVVGAGIVMLAIGLTVNLESGLVVGGTVVTTAGLVLLYQNATGNWYTWAYAWALVGPSASGLGLLLWGLRTADGRDIRNGMWGLLGGLAFFAVAFLFFEGIIGLSGERLPIAEWVVPVVVIGIGVVILIRGLFDRGEPEPT